jgi:hypothetical protein
MSAKSFPPGGGWIALTAAVAVAAVVSGFGFMPRFENKTVGVVSTGNGTAPGHANASGTPAPGDQSTDTSTGGDSTGSIGGNHNLPGAQAGNVDCAHGKNGGNTATGVTGSQITVATTDVTSGVGRDFLQEAARGMKAAITQVNRAGGICGRQINLLPPVNSGWSRTEGQRDIENFIHGDVFALVGEPDSEGLAGAIDSGAIDNAGMPVVGTDGMLADQYQSPWVWPVAASTVTNMHVIVKYALDHGWATSAKDFAIIFDTKYKFGRGCERLCPGGEASRAGPRRHPRLLDQRRMPAAVLRHLLRRRRLPVAEEPVQRRLRGLRQPEADLQGRGHAPRARAGADVVEGRVARPQLVPAPGRR